MGTIAVDATDGGDYSIFGSSLLQDEAAIRRSWDRCQSDHGLDPGHGKDVPTLSRREISAHEDELGEIVSFAEHMLERLYQQIAGSGYVVVLTNKEGLVLRDVVDPICAGEIHRAGVRSGANWSEASQGTNAIGCAIRELMPSIVHQSDHYFCRNHALTCAAAPIYDPKGQLLGVLDATSPGHKTSRSQQIHTLAVVLMTVRAMENRILSLSHPSCNIIRLNKRVELIGLEDDSLFAVSDDGIIEGINRRTAEIFVHGMQSQTLIGMRIDQLLDVRVDEVISSNRTAQIVRPVVCRVSGKEFYLAVEARVAKRTTSKTISTSPSKRGAGATAYDLARLAGSDKSMLHNIAMAEKVCDNNVPLLLVGETGTGKGALARAIHNASQRADKPFVTVDCASIPESLIESELFGYRGGAFTGADRQGHKGLIRRSDGGTLFLDEIGDMPLDLQSRLLRVLEEQEVRPLGCDVAVPVDLSIISATHQSLDNMVCSGMFRQDLFYRINGAQIDMTALRDREDIDGVIANILLDNGTTGTKLEPAARKCLSKFDWPGNIRQLRNVLMRAIALADGEIGMQHLPKEFTRAGRQALATSPTTTVNEDDGDEEGFNRLVSFERRILLEALKKNQWQMTITANDLGISRSTLYRRMHKLGVPAKPGSQT